MRVTSRRSVIFSLILAAVTCLVVTLIPGTVSSAPHAADALRTQAPKLYELHQRGAGFYRAHRFQDALQEYQREYEAALVEGNPAAVVSSLNSLEITRLHLDAEADCKAGHFQQGSVQFEREYRLALANGESTAVTQSLNGLAASQFAQFHYKQAIGWFLKARDAAALYHDRQSLGIICFNLSSLYFHLGDLVMADHEAQGALEALGDSGASAFRSQAFSIMMRIRVRQGLLPEAITWLDRAVDAADKSGDARLAPEPWLHFGEEMLFKGNLLAADRALSESLRLSLALPQSNRRGLYYTLCYLRLQEGDLRSAQALFTAAQKSPPDSSLQRWRVDYLRGRILVAQGQTRAALACYRKGIEAAKAWWDEVVPADTLLISWADLPVLSELYDSFIEASLASNPAPSTEAFLAVEEQRAAALRRALTFTSDQKWRKRLPSDYWAALDRLRKAERTALVEAGGPAARNLEQAREELTEREVEAGLSDASGSGGGHLVGEVRTHTARLKSLQREITHDEAFFSFYEGKKASGVWIVTRAGIEYHSLPSRRVLSDLIAHFVVAVEQGLPERDQLGQKLYASLFSDLSVDVLKKPSWQIAASDDLYTVPLAALVVRVRAGQPEYLIEHHSIQRLPGALMLQAQAVPLRDGLFLGIGDGIYNVADARWQKTNPDFGNRQGALPAESTKPVFQLARLAGSRREITSCARLWDGTAEPVLLSGSSASREHFQKALNLQPVIVHIAAHVVSLQGRPGDALVDMGLSEYGEPDVLTRADVENLQVPGAVVVMSGCSSGAGPARSGSGVLGLTRAWMKAGAVAVVASLWPTPDDSGELFRSFYEDLRRRKGMGHGARAVAAAFRTAQVDMLRSHTWRSNPSYWSAFYVLGKD
jgi:CHAT domain-containing protein